jgi:hypothetical protein
MTAIQCPRCSREAVGGRGVWANKKPYCPACGWNVDRAGVSSGKNQKVLAVYIGAIALFLGAIGASAASSQQHRGNFVAFAFILLMLALIAWHRSKSQNSTQAPGVVDAQSTSSSAFRTPANPANPTYERLRILSRPRTIRLKTSVRIFATVYVIVFGSAVSATVIAFQKGGAKADSRILSNLIPFALFGLIWSIITITMLRSVVRDRSLLSEGEIAIATVTSQKFAGGENRESRITYDFKDAAGRTVSGKCADRTRKIFEEMQTPGFYDPNNPAKNVALVGATYEVVES